MLNYFEFGPVVQTSGSEGDVVQRQFLSRALEALLFDGAEPFVQF